MSISIKNAKRNICEILPSKHQINHFIKDFNGKIFGILLQAHCSLDCKIKKRFFILMSLSLSLQVSFSFSFSYSISLSLSLCSSSPSIYMLFVSLFLTAAVCLAGATASLALFKIALAHLIGSPHRLFKIALPEPSQALSGGYEWVGLVKLDLGCGWV